MMRAKDSFVSNYVRSLPSIQYLRSTFANHSRLNKQQGGGGGGTAVAMWPSYGLIVSGLW